MYGAIHIGFINAKYEYMTWINCDDTIMTENFEEAVKNAYRWKYDFVYGNAYILHKNKNKKTFHKSNPFAKFFLKRGLFPFVQPSTFYKKSLYDQVRFRFKEFKICGDLDLFSRFAHIKDIKIKYIRKPLSIFLKYGGSLGDQNVELSQSEKENLFHRPTSLTIFLFRVTRFF